MKRNSKKLILIALLFAATFMGAGYSLLQQQLKIQGNINVKTNFDVKITGIQKYENSGYYVANAGAFYIKDVTEVAEPTFTATTATFNVRMEPESKITYVITVKNSGTMPAIIESAVEEKKEMLIL